MLELQRPHGFLMWKGKKTAVLRPDDQPLDVGVALEVQTGGEAFGIVTLGKPAQMLDVEADRKEYFGEHRVYPHERKKWWPDAMKFLVYPVESFEPYPETLKKGDGAPGYEEGKPPCEDCTHEGSGYCRLHSFVAEKGWTCDDFMDWRGEPAQKEGVMPYEVVEKGDEFCVVKKDGETVKCHASQEKADAHLAALRINVESEEKGTELVPSDVSDTMMELARAAEKVVAELEKEADPEPELSEEVKQRILDKVLETEPAPEPEESPGEGEGEKGPLKKAMQEADDLRVELKKLEDIIRVERSR